MAGRIRDRLTGTRRAGLALTGVLGAVIAIASGTAFASSSGSPESSMPGMSGMSTSAHMSSDAVGKTDGWLNGQTVTFLYKLNYFCHTPPMNGAGSRCEAGTDYTQTPASMFDPLYVVVPLGFTPPKWTLQCPVVGHCIDHPNTIDLSAVLGSGTSDLPLPAHSHIVATAAGHQAEWWNVDVVGVKTLWAWNKIVNAKSDVELQHLQRHNSKEVTGNIPTNLFLYFAVLNKK